MARNYLELLGSRDLQETSPAGWRRAPASSAMLAAVTAIKHVMIDRLALSGQGELEVRQRELDHVVVEAPLAISARGQRVLTVMRTPGDDQELVAGLLHAEGLPSAPMQEAEGPSGEASVDVDLPPSSFAPRSVTSVSGCGVCGRQTIADLERKASSVASDLMVPAHVIASLPARLREHQAVFALTGGLHGAALATPAGELVVVREDVGRHNAVDKVVGWALATGQAAGQLVLVVSGRLGYEIAQKAVAWGVPIVVSVSAPSSLAIEVAERFRVALCGFTRGDRFNVYSHGWRIE